MRFLPTSLSAEGLVELQLHFDRPMLRQIADQVALDGQTGAAADEWPPSLFFLFVLFISLFVVFVFLCYVFLFVFCLLVVFVFVCSVCVFCFFCWFVS